MSVIVRDIAKLAATVYSYLLYHACVMPRQRTRPAEIEDRALPGHWEGDLIAGTNNSAIATLLDRGMRFTVLCKVKDKRAASVV